MNLKNEFFYKLLFKCLVNWVIYEKRSMPGRNTSPVEVESSAMLCVWSEMSLLVLHRCCSSDDCRWLGLADSSIRHSISYVDFYLIFFIYFFIFIILLLGSLFIPGLPVHLLCIFIFLISLYLILSTFEFLVFNFE